MHRKKKKSTHRNVRRVIREMRKKRGDQCLAEAFAYKRFSFKNDSE